MNPISSSELWTMLQRALHESTPIRNWTRDRGFGGDDFSAHAEPNGIVCLLPKSSSIYVPRADFERVFEIWGQYCTGEVLRRHLRDEVTRHSKYIISILHQFLDAG